MIEVTGTRLAGHCPMGCGETLHAVFGTVACSHALCPQPSAVDLILADPETEHVVQLQDDGYSIKHPLRERLNDQLLDCDLHVAVGKLAPAFRPGRYRATRLPNDYWDWVPL